MQIYIAPPSQFIRDRQKQLLPTWNIPVAHIILVLQHSSWSWEQSDDKITRVKDLLRENLFRFGGKLIFDLWKQGYLSDLFDPRTGYPLIGTAGEITLDDTAVTRALLGFEVTEYRGCWLLNHPEWGNAVYPSTIVTTAPLKSIEFSVSIASALA